MTAESQSGSLTQSYAIQTICVYCGSSPGSNEAYREDARRLGDHIARAGLRLVYGGGKTGLMGVIADAVIRAGGQVIGVIPRALNTRELAHDGLSELIQVTDMHERKMKMASLSDAFVAMPGGIGTMDEFFEIFTWQQLAFHGKPCAILNTASYYDHLIDFLKHMTAQGFLGSNQLDRLLVAHSPHEVIPLLHKASNGVNL